MDTPPTDPSGASGPFELASQRLGPLPVVNHFLARLGLHRLLEQYLPAEDRRLKLAPAAAISVVVRNLVLHREPVYALADWTAPFEPALLGLAAEQVRLLNDDRVGRMLARLFDADRASLLTRLLLDAIAAFGIDTTRLHTDTTSIRFSGAYPGADGRPRGGKPTPAIARGHSKDHRPDLKQLVWSLTVCADGAVPICHRVADGNTNDAAHPDLGPAGESARPGRLPLRRRLQAVLAGGDGPHPPPRRPVPDRAAGQPQGRRPVPRLAHRPRPRLGRGLPPPARRHDDPDEVWWTTTPPWPSAEGYRIVWVKSSSKVDRDAQARRDRIACGIAALDQLNTRLASPKTRIKTTVAAEQAATAALEQANATRWIGFTVTEHVQETLRQEKRGRPGKDTRYRKLTRTHHRISFTVREDLIDRDAASDGCYPLITNDRQMTQAELLAAYKWQPNLQKRHAQLKGTQLVAPVFLNDPARIEGLLFCHFIALLVQALIERQIRAAMAEHGITHLSVYPEDRGSAAPTAARVLDIFTSLARHHLIDQRGRLVQTFQPELSPLQRQTLDLLGVPQTAYLTA